MKYASLLLLAPMLLTACGTLSNKVAFNDTPPAPVQYVKDQTKADDYPGFMAGEGNIYSCRYGIHFQSAEEFDPPKAQTFSSLLAKSAPDIVKQNVVLHRFDVYVNNRLAMLNTVGSSVGGLIGAAMVDASSRNNSVFNFKSLIVDADPLNAEKKLKENSVGCDDKNECEYYASQISGGHAVVVTWLNFDVDSKPYHFKTYYQYQAENKADVAKAIKAGVQLTFEAIGAQITNPAK